ncbi:hypothetical protein K474DRAFT_1706852 [Panus rudis PR-1116 ss-1]|nr:hypothetical protein K474DRAFT_1706852 [Panus rudis PR-1116 ss-1]
MPSRTFPKHPSPSLLATPTTTRSSRTTASIDLLAHDPPKVPIRPRDNLEQLRSYEAMAAAQPIALPPSQNEFDVSMNSGSYTGQNGSFNPASYTRRYLGNPASFRAGSFGSRFYTGVSPGRLLGQLDPNDFRFGKVSSSIESDRGSLMNNLNVFERQDELCRDYQCCGVNLTDMHALVDHFEECHVVVVDPNAPQQYGVQMPAANPAVSQPSYFPDPQSSTTVQQYSQGSFDPDDMELDTGDGSGPSSGSSSPPDTPISTPLSAYPTVQTPLANPQASNRPTPISAFDTATVSRTGHPLSVGFTPLRSSVPVSPTRAEDALNSYAGYSDYSSLLPGATPVKQEEQPNYQNGPYVHPALLLNTTPVSTPGSSRVASPAPGSASYPQNGSSSSASSPTAPSASGSQTPRASTTLSRPATSLLLSKPFKCPKPNCNKSYKQANGLKYHLTHGSCNFAPPKDLEQIQALLESKRKGDGEEPISDAELREVEKEAERRLRPYACGVGDCQRRYKNMNGLSKFPLIRSPSHKAIAYLPSSSSLGYHYQHSGDHGAIGLALLASGQHECLQHTRSRHTTPATSAAPSTHTSPRTTPVVSKAQPVIPTTVQVQSQQTQQQSQSQYAYPAPPAYHHQQQQQQTANSMPPPAYTPQNQHQHHQQQQQFVNYSQPHQQMNVSVSMQHSHQQHPHQQQPQHQQHHHQQQQGYMMPPMSQ